MSPRHRTLLFLIEIVAAPLGFATEIVWPICIFFTKTNVLTTISVLKPKDPRATVFAIANMSAIELLFIDEGINALFLC